MPPRSAAARSGCTRSPEADAAGEHVTPHRPVAEQAVPGIGEGRRPVLLEEEVADPGEAVAGDEADQQPPEIQRRYAVQYCRKPERSPEEVQATAGRVRMLR